MTAMPFQFRLKVLLQHREYLHKRAQMALATAQRRYDNVESQIRKLKEEVRQQTLLWQERQAAGIQVTDYLAFRDYLQSLEQHLLKLNTERERAVKEVEKERKTLIEKEKEVKILESLKEQGREEYHHLELSKEQKHLDEVAIFRDYYKKSSP
jgi:flagellar export protein FliJ